MPRPKKVQPVEETFESNVEELVFEEPASVESPQEEVKSEENIRKFDSDGSELIDEIYDSLTEIEDLIYEEESDIFEDEEDGF